jgi:hypothetical protein
VKLKQLVFVHKNILVNKAAFRSYSIVHRTVSITTLPHSKRLISDAMDSTADNGLAIPAINIHNARQYTTSRALAHLTVTG